MTTHAVLHLSIDAPDARTLPILLELNDPKHPEVNLTLARYSRFLQREGTMSYEAIQKMVAAVGKLRDFYFLVYGEKSLIPGDMKSLLEDFLFAFDHGSELGWRPASSQQYARTRRYVCDYVNFLGDTKGLLLQPNELQFLKTCRESYISSVHAHKSLLFHTKKRSRKRSAGRKKVIVGLQNYIPFPPHLVHELIECTTNVRDKLILGFLAYGGRRISELLQLFLEDIEIREYGLAVLLRHPSQSPMTWMNKAHRMVKGPRREYLKEMHNVLPRTDHGKLRSAVGWKGVKFDDLDRMQSEMYFIHGVEGYLLQLHRKYLGEIRARRKGYPNPYYFVCEKGRPLSLKAFAGQFRLACRRLEKRHGISLKGYGPHSLRHFYGFFCTDVLRVPLLTLQKLMGHLDPSSTAIYAHISPGTARAALSQADATARIEGRISVPTAEREKVRKEFEEAGLSSIPEAWKLSSTAFGTLDTRTMTRALP